MQNRLSKSLSKGLAVGIIAGLLSTMSVASILASEPGFDPGHAGAPSRDWISIAPGVDHWYAFRDEGDRESIEIILDAEPNDRASFKVVTQEDIRRWRAGERLLGVGAGTQNDQIPGDLFWTGSFVKGDTYYVLVEGDNFIPSTYKLNISGQDVSFPTIIEPALTDDVLRSELGLEVDNVGIVADVVAAAAGIAVELTGFSPDMALAPVGEYMRIQPGQTQWYAFRDEGDQTQISINVDAAPDNGVSFEIWTPAQLRKWAAGDSFDPVGAGTKNDNLKADLFWAGSFIKGDTYYVVVKHSGLSRAPTTYSVTVTGDDVSY